MENFSEFLMKRGQNNIFSLGKKIPLYIVLLLVLQIAGTCSMQHTQADNRVYEAYQLRMNGKVDQAKELLENILADDSTNAMAYYELARLKNYQLLGGENRSVEEIIHLFEKAEKLDPENVIYAYNTAIVNFLKAYMTMHKNPEKAKEIISITCEGFQKVLRLKPDYPEVLLYLVEIYGFLPPEMGGDSMKALQYTEKLNRLDDYYGAKAKLVLSGEEVDPVGYWKELLSTHENDARIFKELGRACLYQEAPSQATVYFEAARNLDPAENVLVLDLARYHMMRVMQDKDLADEELPKSARQFEAYLAMYPAPIIPLQAYTYGNLAKIAMFAGKQEDAEKLMQQANDLDPCFSRAFGIPSQSLFDPPDVINHHFTSFFMPF